MNQMDEKPKKERKRISLAAQLKALKMKNEELEQKRWDTWEDYLKAQNELIELQRLFPKKYYEIKFKIKCNDGHIVESQEIHEGYCYKHAENHLKQNKTHPDTFELITFNCLGA